jgi:hypothetical protein
MALSCHARRLSALAPSRRVSSDVVLVRSVRTVVSAALRLATSVDEAAERMEEASERARALVRRLPVPRGPDER